MRSRKGQSKGKVLAALTHGLHTREAGRRRMSAPELCAATGLRKGQVYGALRAMEVCLDGTPRMKPLVRGYLDTPADQGGLKRWRISVWGLCMVYGLPTAEDLWTHPAVPPADVAVK